MSVRVRFAPSPTGNVHVGTARTTLFNWLFARAQGGAFVLRIEDTDRLRSTEESLRGILDGLRWLGLDWDEGPEVGGPHAPYFQMQRLQLYGDTARRLLEEGHAYPCYCAPEELEERRREAQRQGRPFRYDGRCRQLSAAERREREAQGIEPALRLVMPEAGETAYRDLVYGEIRFPNADLDDWIILRSNGLPTYNFAVVVDDVEMEISHVIRGSDHIANTPRQLHVYRALGEESPAFAHVPMVHGPDGKRLSKRHGPTSLLEYRQLGYLSEALANFLALLGWSPGDDREILTREEMIQAFELERINPSPARFNLEKLDWMNGVYLRSLPPQELARRLEPFLRAAGLEADAEALMPWVPLIQERMKTLREGVELVDFAFREVPPPAAEALLPAGTGPEEASRALAGALEILEASPSWTGEELEGRTRGLAAELGMSTGALFTILRVGVTGRRVAPPLFETMARLGRDPCLRRLTVALEALRSAAAPAAQTAR